MEACGPRPERAAPRRVDDVEDGEVVTVDDDSVFVRYTRPELDFFGVDTGNVGQEVCYRFPLQDPDSFRRVTCP